MSGVGLGGKGQCSRDFGDKFTSKSQGVGLGSTANIRFSLPEIEPERS
jgi:hypothetical protein